MVPTPRLGGSLHEIGRFDGTFAARNKKKTNCCRWCSCTVQARQFAPAECMNVQNHIFFLKRNPCWCQGVPGLDGAPCSNLRSFGSKRTVLKKVLATFLGLFGARGIVTPSLRPWLLLTLSLVMLFVIPLHCFLFLLFISLHRRSLVVIFLILVLHNDLFHDFPLFFRACVLEQNTANPSRCIGGCFG